MNGSPHIGHEPSASAQHQRHVGAGCLVDGVLQRPALVLGAARAHAEMQRIDAEHRQRRRDGALAGERVGYGGSADGRKGEEVAAINGHGGLAPATEP